MAQGTPASKPQVRPQQAVAESPAPRPFVMEATVPTKSMEKATLFVSRTCWSRPGKVLGGACKKTGMPQGVPGADARRLASPPDWVLRDLNHLTQGTECGTRMRELTSIAPAG